MTSDDTQGNKVWYSICSAHREYDITCSRCNVGSWMDKDNPEKRDYLWFTDREGNEVFPFPNMRQGKNPN